MSFKAKEEKVRFKVWRLFNRPGPKYGVYVTEGDRSCVHRKMIKTRMTTVKLKLGT